MTQIIGLPADVTTVDAPGFYMVPHDVYHSPAFTPTLAINQSGIKTILNRSPAHFFTEACAPREADKAMDLGTAVHAMLLGRGAEIVEIPHDDFRTKAAKELRDEAIAAGRCPLLTKDMDRAKEIVEVARFSLQKIPGAWDAFVPGRGHSEVAMVWTEAGVWCKSQIDWLSNDGAQIWDLKTTSRSAAPQGLARLMVEQGFEVQGAMIKRGIEHLRPELKGRVKVRFAIVEVDPPYGVSVLEMDNTALTMGAKKVDLGIRTFRVCMSRGSWPGYPAVIHKPEYLPWEETRFLAQEEAAYADPDFQKLSNDWQRP